MKAHSAAILAARQEHYGSTISAGNVFRTIAPFAIYFVFPAECVWHSWVVSLVVFCAAFLVGCTTQISPNISINYYRNVLRQEELFMSNMTLALSQHSQTPINALDRAQNGLQGEFKTDMAKLEDIIHHNIGGQLQIHNAFEKIRYKYRSDRFFCQYMQLVENAFKSGTVNRQALDNVNEFHNAQFQCQKRYITARHINMISVWELNLILSIILFGTQFFILHISTWENLFAWKLSGGIIGTIYILVLMITYCIALNWSHDESIVNY